MNKPRMIIGIHSRMFVDMSEANQVVDDINEKFPDYEVTIVMDLTHIEVLRPREDD